MKTTHQISESEIMTAVTAFVRNNDKNAADKDIEVTLHYTLPEDGDSNHYTLPEDGDSNHRKITATAVLKPKRHFQGRD